MSLYYVDYTANQLHCYVFGFRKCFAWTLAKELQPGMRWNTNTSRTLVLYPDRVSPSRLSLVNIGSLKEEKFCRFNFLQVNCVLVLYYYCRSFFAAMLVFFFLRILCVIIKTQDWELCYTTVICILSLFQATIDLLIVILWRITLSDEQKKT